MLIRSLWHLSYYWYKNKMDEQDRLDAYWDGDTQDLYHQQQLEDQEMATAKYEQKPGTIAVFSNDKEGNEKRPDWQGNLMTMAHVVLLTTYPSKWKLLIMMERALLSPLMRNCTPTV